MTDDTKAEIKYLRQVLEMRPIEIAARLGVTRQLVNYHLKDRGQRKRALLPKRELARQRALARKRYERGL